MVPKHTSKTTSEDVMSCKAKLLHGEKCLDESSPQCLINSMPCANVLQWVNYEPHNVYIQIYCTKEIAIQRYYLTTYSLFKGLATWQTFFKLCCGNRCTLFAP